MEQEPETIRLNEASRRHPGNGRRILSADGRRRGDLGPWLLRPDEDGPGLLPLRSLVTDALAMAITDRSSGCLIGGRKLSKIAGTAHFVMNGALLVSAPAIITKGAYL